MNFMETVGLECAVWPHLYWCTEMCETYVRSQDLRRLARAEAPQRQPARGGDDSDSDEVDDPEQDFVYDLWLWSSLGGAKHSSGVSLRGALAGRSFSPAYWQNMHLALVDVVKQIGFPALFITVAPFEPTAPYHLWLEDELQKTLRTRTNLPAAETFHLAHLLVQVAEGLICGSNKRNRSEKSKCWKEHVLSAADGETDTVVEVFGRLEFQDGKRKRHVGPAQSYHGSGRAHLHLLVWMKNMDALDWSKVLRADLASHEPELHDLVKDSQLDYDNSAWPLQEGPTTFDRQSHRILLHHPADAKAKHVRAFLPDVLAAMQCHMDVLTGDGRALLLQYVASYAAKFSDSFAQSWLNEEASAYHLARRILSEYHPLEPEMWLQLGAQHFRQVIATPVMRCLSVRPPWTGPPGEWEQRYMGCSWREDDCTLLEFMRASNKNGRQRSTRTGGGRRRVAVAARMNSHLKDAYYGQWLVLNVPFRNLDELWTDRELRNLQEQPLARAPHAGRPLCVLGPAGSGKSTCLEVVVQRAVEAGAQVGVACPTGVLASSYRVKFPDLDVDTLHGMFRLHKPEHETWDLMIDFDLIVIDEVGQLSRDIFER
ncbi:unnamed protein product, partial [Symbiodinium pilosum]